MWQRMAEKHQPRHFPPYSSFSLLSLSDTSAENRVGWSRMQLTRGQEKNTRGTEAETDACTLFPTRHGLALVSLGSLGSFSGVSVFFWASPVSSAKFVLRTTYFCELDIHRKRRQQKKKRKRKQNEAYSCWPKRQDPGEGKGKMSNKWTNKRRSLRR